MYLRNLTQRYLIKNLFGDLAALGSYDSHVLLFVFGSVTLLARARSFELAV